VPQSPSDRTGSKSVGRVVIVSARAFAIVMNSSRPGRPCPRAQDHSEASSLSRWISSVKRVLRLDNGADRVSAATWMIAPGSGAVIGANWPVVLWVLLERCQCGSPILLSSE
jgi:hypothetical protein